MNESQPSDSYYNLGIHEKPLLEGKFSKENSAKEKSTTIITASNQKQIKQSLPVRIEITTFLNTSIVQMQSNYQIVIFRHIHDCMLSFKV